MLSHQHRNWPLLCCMLMLPVLYIASVYGLAYATGRNWIPERTSFDVARTVFAPLRWYIHSSGLPGGRRCSRSIQTVYLWGKDDLIAERAASLGTSR